MIRHLEMAVADNCDGHVQPIGDPVDFVFDRTRISID